MVESIFSNLSSPLNQEEEEEKVSPITSIPEVSPITSIPEESITTPSIFGNLSTSIPEEVRTTPSIFGNLSTPIDAPSFDPITSTKFSQTELYANPEFQRVAERFMESIGSDEDVFEYMRDADWRLGSTITRAAQIGNWNDQQKRDYVYLRNAFNNADLTGVGEWLQATKDIGIDVLTDPANWLALVFAAPSLGGSAAIKATAHTAASLALKQMGKKQLSTATVKELTKNLPKGLKNQVTLDAAKGAGKFEMVHGGAWLGLYDYFMQTSDIGLGVHQSNEIDWGKVGLSTTLGAGLAGTAGFALGGISARRYLIREFNATNEEAIRKEAQRVLRSSKTDKKIIPLLKENEKLGIRNIHKFIAATTGKATTEYLGIAKAGPAIQDFLGRFHHAWDQTTFGKKIKEVRLPAFGASLMSWQAKLLTKADIATNDLYRQSSWWKFITDRENARFNHLTDEDNNQLWYLITNPYRKKVDGKDISPEIRESAKQIREVLKEIFKEGNKHGVWKDWQKIENYLPRKWQYAIVEKDRKKLERILIKYGLADPLTDREIQKGVTASGKEIDVVLVGEKQIDEKVFGTKEAKKWLSFYEQGNLKAAQESKASHIVDTMLDSRFTPFELRPKAGGYGFLKHRPFAVIPDEVIKDFLETDVEKLLKDYIINSTAVIKRAEFFGKNADELYEKFLTPIRSELSSHVGKDGEKLLSTNEIDDIISSLENMHNKVTGVDAQVIKNKHIRTAVESLKLIQQMAHLPLATLSSLTEPMIMLSRVGWEDGPVVTKEVFKSLGKETARSVDRTVRAVQRGFGKKVKGRGRDLDDEVWLELYENGLALEQAVMDRIEGMHGTNFQNVGTRAMQNMFFKSNLLTQWTGAVQLASFTIGKRVIVRNSEKLYKHSKGIKKLTKGQKNLVEEELIDLGINPNEAMSWYNRYYKNGEFNATKEGGAFGSKFYQDKVGAGASRFTNEIILNPSGMQANKPLWFSNPNVNFLVQFLGYPTVFNNTILKRFVNDSYRHPVKVGSKVVATTMLMTSAALVTNYIRTVGIQRNEKWYNEQSDLQHLEDAWTRWGGAAWADFGIRYAEARERGSKLLPSVGRLFGPIGQDIAEIFQYNRGILETVARNVPYSAWLPTEVKREMYRRAKKIEGKLEVVEEVPYKQPTTKGRPGYGSRKRKKKKKRPGYGN